MNQEGLIVAIFVLAVAAFAVALWALALGLLHAEHRKAAHRDDEIGRIARELRNLRAQYMACEERLELDPDNLAAQCEREETAYGLAEIYEDVCRVMASARGGMDSDLYRAYGEEILSWVEEGPVRDQYMWRVSYYPATAEFWRSARTRAHRRQEAGRAP